MNTKIKLTLLVSALLLTGASLLAGLVSPSSPTTYELAFAFLVTGVLAGLAVSEYRTGNPRRLTDIGFRRFPRT